VSHDFGGLSQDVCRLIFPGVDATQVAAACEKHHKP
jgi:hypothetical protein